METQAVAYPALRRMEAIGTRQGAISAEMRTLDPYHAGRDRRNALIDEDNALRSELAAIMEEATAEGLAEMAEQAAARASRKPRPAPSRDLPARESCESAMARYASRGMSPHEAYNQAIIDTFGGLTGIAFGLDFKDFRDAYASYRIVPKVAK